MPVDPILDIAAIERFGIDTGVFALMNSKWGWPVCEIIHFFGLCLLIGSVGMFDLRMMGVARGVPIASLHRLVPFGVAGWLLCAATGVLFILAAPSQYLYNPAFQTKMTLMGLAGANMALFYLTTAPAMGEAGADDLPIPRARAIAFISLACWLGVIACGRLITFFRPPYHWCVWCQ
jgi:hypothetical protein